mmetsp:Transcript_107950/g.232578  ORF Transcript_107950/g.232578 Transcript_107950/m.232578 type:complete len:101 (+) Transcript_107950:1351-1653(+)
MHPIRCTPNITNPKKLTNFKIQSCTFIYSTISTKAGLFIMNLTAFIKRIIFNSFQMRGSLNIFRMVAFFILRLYLLSNNASCTKLNGIELTRSIKNHDFT